MIRFLLLALLPTLVFAQKEVVIHIKTDGYPSETRWILYDSVYQGDTIDYVEYGHYTQPNFMHRDTLYIDSVQNISFVIYDSYGDGIVNGEYYVTICGDTVVDYPVSTFNSGLIHNRAVPQCLPNPPPPTGPCIPTMININLDQFTDETSWEITDTMGNVLISGGPYPNVPDYQPQYIPTCLPTGVLRFTIYDTYGDGLAGSQWGGNDGSYYLIQCGDTLVYGTVPNFGTDSTHVFVSDTCIPPPPVPGCMDDNYVEFNPAATVSDSSCATLKIYGCIDSTMFNYDSIANTMDYIDSCDYTLVLHDLAGNGWVGSKLEIYQEDTSAFIMTSGFNQVYSVQLKAPELVKMKFFVNQQASPTALECGFTLINPMGDTMISIQPPFIQPFFVYQAVTYCGNECIEIVEGCMDSIAFNYDSLANTSLPCYYVPGCMSPAYLEYHIDTSNAVFADINIQDSCNTLAVFGCTDTTSFNYDSLANVDNGGCVPIILGCMESFAFNYNPLANTDDGSCIPYIYGCIDPTMFNYDANANTDNGTCIPFVYGCTDSTAFNYDPTANADNGSCIQFTSGCMDPDAWNYDASANVSDTSACLYAANCITGPGNPYWLNDECYAWVIDVDEYCCDNEWDNICQLTYDYCEGTWVGPMPKRMANLIMVTDLLGRPAKITNNQVLLFIYDDGTVEQKLIINK